MPSSANTGSLSHGSRHVEDLFREHAATVLAYALRRGVQLADAEDIAAETFLICHKRIRDVPDDALPWLLAVARRVLSHHFRAERRRRALALRLLAAGADRPRYVLGPRVPGGGSLVTAYKRLPPGERQVVRLVALEGANPAEAARALGITRKAVYCRLSRVRAKMRALGVDVSLQV